MNGIAKSAIECTNRICSSCDYYTTTYFAWKTIDSVLGCVVITALIISASVIVYKLSKEN